MTKDADKNTGAQAADTVSKADHEAAVEKAKADAVAAERARVAVVTGSEHYAGREKLAHSLLDTDLPAEKIVSALENAPKAEAEKAESEDESAGKEKAGGEHFKKFMDKDGHPNVGSEVQGNEDEQDSTEKRVTSIMGAYARMTGEAFGDKKKAH